MLLIGGIGIGKSAILNRFIAEQPFVLAAAVKSGIERNRGAPPTTAAIIDDIGRQFGLPNRSVLGT